MEKPIVLQAICSFGVGSSTLLRIKLEGLCKELGVDAKVFNNDVPSGPSTPSDAIFCSADLAEMMMERAKVPVYPIKNFVDKKELTTQLNKFLETRK